MGSPITFSGFNNIDFNVVLNAIMQQESQPLTALQAQQRALQATDSELRDARHQARRRCKPATSALSNAVRRSSTYAATSSDTAAIGATATPAPIAGRYDVVVNELARAQVTVSSSPRPTRTRRSSPPAAR